VVDLCVDKSRVQCNFVLLCRRSLNAVHHVLHVMKKLSAGVSKKMRAHAWQAVFSVKHVLVRKSLKYPGSCLSDYERQLVHVLLRFLAFANSLPAEANSGMIACDA
jgi:hypothetical protein